MIRIIQLLVVFFIGKLLERSVAGAMDTHSNSYIYSNLVVSSKIVNLRNRAELFKAGLR